MGGTYTPGLISRSANIVHYVTAGVPFLLPLDYRRNLFFPHRSPDGDEGDESGAVAPLLPHPAATGGAAVTGAAASAERDTPSATSARAWRREVVARLVSSSGPVAAQHARRGPRRGRSGSGLPRGDILPAASAAAAAAEAREQRRSVRRTRNEPEGDIEEGNGEEDHPLATHGLPGLSFDLSFGDGGEGAAASVMEADGSGVETSSQGASESEGDSSANREWVELRNPLHAGVLYLD